MYIIISVAVAKEAKISRFGSTFPSRSNDPIEA